jgi:sugar/nucleoside kinase (ribokinase family)
MKYDFIAIGGSVEDVSFYTDQGQVIDNPGDVLRQKLLGFEYGAKIRAKALERFPGGGANNVAVSLSRLGFVVGLLSSIGNDDTGKRLVDNLDENGVDTRLIKISRRSDTGFSLMVIDKAGEHIAFTYRGANDELHVSSVDSHVMSSSKWLCISSLSGEWEDVLNKVFAIKGVRVAWNPGAAQLAVGAPRLHKWLKKTELLCFNHDEAVELAISHPSFRRRGQEFLKDKKALIEAIKKLGPQKVIITSGSHGADYFDGENHYHQPSLNVPKSKIADTAGVGDAFFSGTLAGLEKYSGDIKKAMALAMRNAAANLKKPGAQAGLMKL